MRIRHIDEWLDEPPKDENARLAKEWLEHHRRDPGEQDNEWCAARYVTCRYFGHRWRCLGAEVNGAVLLVPKETVQHLLGTHIRYVSIDACSDWQVEIRKYWETP